MDTSERDTALAELRDERARRVIAESEKAQAVLQFQMTRLENERLRKELMEIRTQLAALFVKFYVAPRLATDPRVIEFKLA